MLTVSPGFIDSIKEEHPEITEKILENSTKREIKQKLYGAYNCRELVEDDGTALHVDETKLDLFSYYDETLPKWEPKTKPKPYKELSQIILDIETTGLDPKTCQIALIGVMNEKGEHCIVRGMEREKKAILVFFEMMERRQPDILAVFNGFNFDLPFIIHRAKVHRLTIPFEVKTDLKTFRTAQKNSRPAQYYPIWLKNKYTGKHTAIIDLYHQVLCWDFVRRELTEHNLKQAPLQMGLRHDERVELDNDGIQECIKTGNWELLNSYLLDDLKDTKLLTDYLVPPIYYQKIFLNEWKLQSLSASGNGSKWQSIIEKEYPQSYQPESCPKRRYQGALTLALAGLYGLNKPGKRMRCSKFDIESLYPSTQLLYGICSKKDYKKVQLRILEYMRNERLKLKYIAEKTKDLEADQMQGTMKVMINSSYGSCGTTGIKFNDYYAAALVTGYARGIFRHIIKRIHEYPSQVRIVSCDTDGFIVEHPEGEEKQLLNWIQEVLPGNDRVQIKIKLEWTAKAVFVPVSDKKIKLDESLISDNDLGTARAGLKKNYIIVNEDKDAQEKATKKGREKTIMSDRLKYNGKYRKRDRAYIDKTFQPTVIDILVNQGELAARRYFKELKKEFVNKTYPLEKLCITRKIKRTDNRLIELGIGKAEDIATFYRTFDTPIFGKRGYMLKQSLAGWAKFGSSIECDYNYYLNILEKQFEEIMQFWDIDKEINQEDLKEYGDMFVAV